MKYFDPKKIYRYSIHERRHLVDIEHFGKPVNADASFADFIDSLPKMLAADKLRAAINAIRSARANGRPVHAGMGAHVIKTGLAPIIIDLLERGLFTGLSFNGAAVVHDLELAFIGKTSEDVGESLKDGSFGFSRETAQMYMSAAAYAVEHDCGLGEAVGTVIEREKLPYRELSMFAACRRLGLPATVHCAIGTDIVHMHPEMDGAALGKASHKDFLRLAAVICDLEGGVFLNIGSAVVLPEVFLKCLSMARNTGYARGEFTTVNLDMLTHYRPSENVLRRPGGTALNITGHHEIMLPLLRMALISAKE